MPSSPLYPNEIIIDDSTPERAWHAESLGYGTGWEKPTNAGYGSAASAFPDELLIPESEWQARIKEREERGMQLSQAINAAGLPCKNQQSTSFCWANAPTHAIEILRMQANLPYVDLSAASVACSVTGFRDIAGWAANALTVIQNDGIIPASLWPTNAISRKYDSDSNWKIGSQYRVDKWWTAPARTIKYATSMALRSNPVPVAYNWWEHEVNLIDAIWLDGQLAWRLRNNWGWQYGSNGFFILRGPKMVPDDIVCPATLNLTKGAA